MSFDQLLAVYGPAAVPMFGLMLVVKYLLDKDKQRELSHKEEMKAERANTKAERDNVEALQAELLAEARGNALLAEELKRAMETLAGKGTAQ